MRLLNPRVVNNSTGYIDVKKRRRLKSLKMSGTFHIRRSVSNSATFMLTSDLLYLNVSEMLVCPACVGALNKSTVKPRF